LPIGGLKEKSLAALRAGVARVIYPAANEKDLPEIPNEARERMEFRAVATVEEALELVLEPVPPSA
jgi:ATP-dependent Lon protease